MVDEEHAFEVVHLMLEADRQHASDLLVMLHAIFVEPAGADAVGALDLGILLRHGETALIIGHFDVAMRVQLGIDEDARVFHRLAALFLRLLQVDHQQPDRHAHLHGGEADARRLVHGLEHVGDQLARLVGHLRERRGFLTQPRIGHFENFKQSHGGEISRKVRFFKRPAALRARPAPASPRPDNPARHQPAGHGQAG